MTASTTSTASTARSLRARMRWALGLSIAVAWCGALVAIFVFSTHSSISIWDDKLQSIGVKMVAMVPGAGLGAAGPRLEPRPDLVAENARLSFQIWSERRTLLSSTLGSPSTPMNPAFTDGFSNVEIGGESWRVYSASDRTGTVQVQVGSPRRLINAPFQRNALTALGIATALLSLLGLAMGWAVRRALRPLRQIEATVRARASLDMTPLAVSALPAELVPLVHGFNHLLAKLDATVQAERRFIGDAAHELRTPMTVVKAQAEVALRATTLEDKDAALVKLLAATQRSSRLAEQLLDLARLDAGEQVPVRAVHDLNDIVRHVVDEFEMLAGRSQRRISVDAEPCGLLCDVDELGILLRNLVDNAVRYTSPGGQVVVRCGPTGPEAAEVFLEVVDDGPGVPQDERDAIFERFHRVTGNPVRGSGIGLSLVARIARLHHARIETGTGLGNAGLRVRLSFPALKRN
ncbi:sensor histidine kinase [Roseateles sp. L2-2]|uniref:sensor histidine kinase n=1 Tax=Roseateles TaxID=93681 RepID=UPI003D35C29B